MFLRCNIVILLLFMIALTAPRLAGAESVNYNVGLGAGVTASEYKDTDPTVLPLPIINSEGEHFYVRGLTGGLHIYKDGMHEFSLALTYMPQHFTAENSGSRAMRRLDDRYATLMAGPAYRLTSPYGVVRLSLAADVLGVSNGLTADASYAYPIPLGRVVISPLVGVNWTSASFNDYYYGISATESRKTGFSQYEPEDAFSPYAGINVRMAITDNLGAFVNGSMTFLNNQITDSPMVDRSSKSSIGAGLAYSF